ncbi:N-acetylmuramoyl-L-alanine amidase family protein [Bacillus sp. FJAT-26390]|uniref:peptidoglycan recognition protein family protein n=1 Tax=Bacillus sp. FJAT-26390 TaxID=1743142 RepID=UPI000807AEB0|nr:N-acetylmuramoyl-L-alanine amidase [Bacillus sp. FJAT-26390]OBZ13327.1 N-acetylmuramoyl-L-alanine amidase [Bacillus sp. FJAT-26390]
MVNYTIDHIPKTTPLNRRPGHALNATTITIHNTGNPTSSAKNERAWLTNPSNSRVASYHIAVDEHGAIECLPLNENGWHAGDGNESMSGNRTSIGIEICENGNYAKTLDNAAELVANMLKARGWGVDRLRRHYDWNGKICPRLMYNKGTWLGWTAFKAAVAAKLVPQILKEEEDELTKLLAQSDANKIIAFLSASYMAASDGVSRAEFKRLANELRRVSGQAKQ